MSDEQSAENQAAESQTPEVAEVNQGDERVGFGKRLGAYLIDGVAVSIFGFVIGGAAGGGMAEVPEGGDPAAAILQAFESGGNVWVALIGFAYVMIEAFTAASPGKMILGIHIMTADGDAASPGVLIPRTLIKGISNVLGLLAAALGVAALNYASMLAGFVVIIGCFLVLSESKQALHDRIFGTAVYRKAD